MPFALEESKKQTKKQTCNLLWGKYNKRRMKQTQKETNTEDKCLCLGTIRNNLMRNQSNKETNDKQTNKANQTQ